MYLLNKITIHSIKTIFVSNYSHPIFFVWLNLNKNDQMANGGLSDLREDQIFHAVTLKNVSHSVESIFLWR